MPNWCNNVITIKGPAQEVNAIYEKCRENGDLFNALHPMPENIFTGNLGDKERKECAKQGIPNWYDWCTSNWGCKWDASDANLDYEDAGDGEATLSGYFDSPWGPPTGVYEHCEEAHPNLYIYAEFFEPGMSFAGTYESGVGEDTIDIPQTKAEVEAQIPELNETFGITDMMEDEEEELSTWMREGAESRKKELVNG